MVSKRPHLAPLSMRDLVDGDPVDARPRSMATPSMRDPVEGDPVDARPGRWRPRRSRGFRRESSVVYCMPRCQNKAKTLVSIFFF